MGTTVSTPRWPGRRTEAALLFGILVIAALFRFYQLASIPPGFTHDEAGHGHDAIAIVHGARPLYETVGYGREPLYDYVVAMFMPFLGENYLTLRIVSALAGLLLIVVMHFWVRRAFDVPTAIATSAFLATSFWATMVSRQALRSALLPLLFTASIFFMWQAVRPYAKPQTLQRRWPVISRLLSYVLAGLLLGLALMTYMAARVLPIVFVLFWIYLFIFHRKVWRDNWFGVFFIIGLGLLIAWPMFNYIASTPGAEQRLSQLSGPIDQLFAGNPQELLSNIFGALGMFMFNGDNLWLYNIPGRAILGLILGPMALLGLILAIVRFKRMEYALAIFWLAAGIFPSLITGVVASNLRSIAALPVVYLFVAIGLLEIMRALERLVESHTLRTIPLALLAVGVTLFSWNAYFDQWATAGDVRVAYHTTLFEVAQELDRASDLPTDVAISSIYPNRFHDPYAHAVDAEAQGHAAALVYRIVCGYERRAARQPDFSAARRRCGVVCADVNGAGRMFQWHRARAERLHQHGAGCADRSCRPCARCAAELQHDDRDSIHCADRSDLCGCVQSAFRKNPIG